MTTEELKLKVSLDTSGLKQDVAKVKTTMKQAEGSLTNVGTDSMKKGLGAASDAAAQLQDELESIRNLSIPGMIAGFSK